jgi:hypothetical protein
MSCLEFNLKSVKGTLEGPSAPSIRSILMLLSLSSFVDLFKYAAQLDNAMVGAALVAYIEK